MSWKIIRSDKVTGNERAASNSVMEQDAALFQ